MHVDCVCACAYICVCVCVHARVRMCMCMDACMCVFACMHLYDHGMPVSIKILCVLSINYNDVLWVYSVTENEMVKLGKSLEFSFPQTCMNREWRQWSVAFLHLTLNSCFCNLLAGLLHLPSFCLSSSFNFIFSKFLQIFNSGNHPDMTFAVDWVLKTNDLSINSGMSFK